MIGPDDIIDEQDQLLSAEDKTAADRLEKQIDKFLRFNYFKDGFANYYGLREDVPSAVLFELVKRYRAAGWCVQVSPSVMPEEGYDRPVLSFTKNSGEDQEWPSTIGSKSPQ